GRVLIFGVAPLSDYIAISPYEIYSKELTITGSFVNPYTNSRALALIEEKRINIEKIISHKFSLREIEKAILTGLSGEALRVILYFEE
ncbi:MAG: alcohol dehydrogenase, partial [Dictyoglomus sp.]